MGMANTFELSAELLQPILTSYFGAEADATDFALKALKPGLGNPTSLGVYRASGEAKTKSGSAPFSLVVKHLANGLPFMDASQGAHWNFWRREITFFESSIAGQIPNSIVYPKYFGHSQLPDGTALFWSEDMGDLSKSEWTWAECLHAAELAAELNSINLGDLSDAEWLNRSMLAGWYEYREEYFTPFYPRVIELASADLQHRESYEKFLRYLPMQLELSDVVRDARQCFAHGDFNLNNLVPRGTHNNKLIALDWQLCGISGVGAEIASIFNTAHELGVIHQSSELFEQLCLAYTNRFNELNETNPVAFNDVRLVAAAMGFVILDNVSFFLLRASEDEPAEVTDQNILRLLKNFSEGPVAIYAHVLHELGA